MSAVVLLSALSLGRLTACAGNECSPSSDRCVDSTTIGVCNRVEDTANPIYKWHTASCPVTNAYCVTPAANSPRCALEPTQVPQCEGDAATTCWQGAVAYCDNGFVSNDGYPFISCDAGTD